MRPGSRVRAWCLAVVVSGAGCAIAANTPAQDLAWQRWEQCKNVQGVTLQEIRPDGVVSVFYTGAAPGPQFLECMNRAAANQMRERSLTGPAPAPQAVQRAKL